MKRNERLSVHTQNGHVLPHIFLRTLACHSWHFADILSSDGRDAIVAQKREHKLRQTFFLSLEQGDFASVYPAPNLLDDWSPSV